MFNPCMSEPERELLELVEKEFFHDSPIILDKKDRFGQAVFHGWLVLGTQAAGLSRIEFLFHEMSHLVEIDDKRATKPGWGLRLPMVQSFGEKHPEPKTCQATLREIRTFAYQENLMNHFGTTMAKNDDSAGDSVAETCNMFLPDYFNVPGKCNETRKEWIKGKFDEYVSSPLYSFESFCKEWDRKVGILRRRRRGPKPDLEMLRGRIA